MGRVESQVRQPCGAGQTLARGWGAGWPCHGTTGQASDVCDVKASGGHAAWMRDAAGVVHRTWGDYSGRDTLAAWATLPRHHVAVRAGRGYARRSAVRRSGQLLVHSARDWDARAR